MASTLFDESRTFGGTRGKDQYLTPAEVVTLRQAARARGRYGHRDNTMILIAYRHGLRVSELVSLRWDWASGLAGLLYVNRLKNGTASVHPLTGDEIRALRRVKRGGAAGRYVFET